MRHLLAGAPKHRAINIYGLEILNVCFRVFMAGKQKAARNIK